jgi:hypothetical protein
MRHLGIFINDTNSDIKNKININNIEKLKNNFDNIIIFDNKSEHSYSLNNYFVNDSKIYKYLLANIGNNNELNIEKLSYILKEINIENYDYITVINDNYIYLDDLKEYFEYINKYNLDFYSYTDSTEYFYHYQLYFFTFKSIYLNKLIEQLDSIVDYNNKISILNIITSIFKNKISYLKVAYLDNNYQQNVYFNDTLFKNLLENNIIKVIYINKLNTLINNYKNEIFVDIPRNFDIQIYKNHDDLKSFPDNLLINHFLTNGQFESRNYSKENYILPKYIRKALLKCNDIISLFDLPEDFNLYNYKQKNNDLANFNRNELIIHYINCGRKEGRKY